MRRRRDEKILRPVHANAGIRAAYRAKLCAIVDEMARSYGYWIKAGYRANPPRMALDAPPAQELRRDLRLLGKRWQDRIDEAAPRLALWFLKSTAKRSDDALRSILRKGGWSVRFSLTPELRDVMIANVEANVSLIKSIGSEYHSEVEGLVMRSVAAGRDLKQLTEDLEDRYDITRRRAELIAVDQNNKATSQLQRTRQLGVGIEEGVWLHSHAGKQPRPTHVANHGKRFDLRTGWFDPDPKVREHIWPGWLIHCGCTWKPVVKGFS